MDESSRTIKTTYAYDLRLDNASPMSNCLFYDIEVGKDGTSPTADDYTIRSPASYSLDTFSTIAISEDSTGKITFGLSKKIRMNETTTLREFGIIGRYSSGGYDYPFLVARDTGAVDVTSGLMVEVRYTVTLNPPSMGAQSGFSRWFNRALANIMTACGYENPLRGTTLKAKWSCLTFYGWKDDLSGTGAEYTPSSLDPLVDLSSALWAGGSFSLYSSKTFTTATHTGDDYNKSLGTLVSSSYGTKMFKVTEATGSLTAEYWEDRTCGTSASIVEYVVFGGFRDTGGTRRVYILHKGQPPSALSVSSGGLVRGYLKLVIS
jgi:hypothetical protein